MGAVPVLVAVPLAGEVLLDQLDAAERLVAGVDARVQDGHGDAVADIGALQRTGDEDAPGGVVDGRRLGGRPRRGDRLDELERHGPRDGRHLAVAAHFPVVLRVQCLRLDAVLDLARRFGRAVRVPAGRGERIRRPILHAGDAQDQVGVPVHDRVSVLTVPGVPGRGAPARCLARPARR